MESRNFISAIRLVQSKSDVSSAVQGFFAQVQNLFTAKGFQFARLWQTMPKKTLSKTLSSTLGEWHRAEDLSTIRSGKQRYRRMAGERVFECDLPDELWGEALQFGNWTKNHWTSSRIKNKVPIKLWKVDSVINFKALLEFETPGYAYFYSTTQTLFVIRSFFPTLSYAICQNREWIYPLPPFW